MIIIAVLFVHYRSMSIEAGRGEQIGTEAFTTNGFLLADLQSRRAVVAVAAIAFGQPVAPC
jgi:hypothetical protein